MKNNKNNKETKQTIYYFIGNMRLEDYSVSMKEYRHCDGDDFPNSNSMVYWVKDVSSYEEAEIEVERLQNKEIDEIYLENGIPPLDRSETMIFGDHGLLIYHEKGGKWEKWEYDNGNEIYYENHTGKIINNR